MKRFIQVVLLLFISSGICFAQQSRQTEIGNPVTAVNKTSVYAVTGIVSVSNNAVPFSEIGNIPGNYPGYHTVAIQKVTQDRVQNQKQSVEITNQATSEFPHKQSEKRIHVSMIDTAEPISLQKKVEITQSAIKVE